MLFLWGQVGFVLSSVLACFLTLLWCVVFAWSRGSTIVGGPRKVCFFRKCGWGLLMTFRVYFSKSKLITIVAWGFLIICRNSFFQYSN